jgi:peptidoglycan/LPS O-acetylase OafA/YrhL
MNPAEPAPSIVADQVSSTPGDYIPAPVAPVPPPAVPATKRPRLYSLDVLRGIAVLMVLVFHATDKLATTDALERAIKVGAYGVDLFFVLSGFLISGLLLNEFSRTSTLKVVRFWLRRGLKIWPAYYFAYGSIFLLILLMGSTEGLSRAKYVLYTLPNFVFVQNYICYEYRWPASWSLAVEEHFYLALPLVILLLARVRWGLAGLPWVCVLTCLVAPIFRYFGSNETEVLLQTHYRMDGLAYGVLLGYAYHAARLSFAPITRWWPAILGLVITALTIAFLFPFHDYALMRSAGVSLIAIAFTSLVALAIGNPGLGRDSILPIRTPVRALSWLGTYSYTIYLMQIYSFVLGREQGVLCNTLAKIFGHRQFVHAALFAAMALVGGVVLSHVIERPFLKLREKWVPDTSRQTT